jgi:hypothetical protein
MVETSSRPIPETSTIGQFNKLIEFRQAIYDHGLTRARDAQFELVDALLVSPPARSLPQECKSIHAADAKYGNHRFLAPLKEEPCAVPVRLCRDRVLYSAPGLYGGRGRPRVHGDRFAFKEPELYDTCSGRIVRKQV